MARVVLEHLLDGLVIILASLKMLWIMVTPKLLLLMILVAQITGFRLSWKRCRQFVYGKIEFIGRLFGWRRKE